MRGRGRSLDMARRRRRRRSPRRWLLIGVAGLVLMSAAGAVRWLTTSSRFAVATVTTGRYRYTDRDTLEAVLREWLGRNLWSLRTGELARELQRLPWVERAEVRRRPPRTLSVLLIEHRPLLLLGEPDDGERPRVLLDDGGVAELPAAVPVPDLPLLLSPRGEEPSPERRRELVELCTAVAETGLETVAPVDFVRCGPDGYALILGGQARRELVLGGSGFRQRLQRYLAVAGQLDPGGRVDLRFSRQITRRPLD